MSFSVFLPSEASERTVPFLIWLSGLTGRDETFPLLAGAQRYAAEHGLAIISPDTSPRGDGVPDDPEGEYDFGKSAGFYLNATQPPWNAHYQMYDYIVDELDQLVTELLPIDGGRQAILGHSMGGHGALTIALKNPSRFKSVSALAPICSPMRCPWGTKALGNYLGDDQTTWPQYDATELIKSPTAKHLPLLVDQGTDDEFLDEQLNIDLLLAASEKFNYPLTLRMQPGYDHGYYFVSSFIGEHITFHAEHLSA